MKSFTRIFLYTSICLAFFSCKEKPLSQIEQQAIAQNEATSAKSVISKSSEDGLSSSKIDYDLSEMNSNMVYAEVFNMMLEPEVYDDKVVKMKGNFVISPTANGGNSYAVLITDALACCQQGIEFKYDFSDTKPKEGDVITVTGVYTTATLPNDVVFNYVKAEKIELN